MENLCFDFNYNYALVCSDVPNSLVNGLSLEEHEPVNLELAVEQHKLYLNLLEESGIKLIKVNSDERYPDCVFVEDTAVALENRIFITNPGAESRRGEIDVVKAKLESVAAELELEIGQVEKREEAFIDGGDVLFTGRELIVGISSRTNQKGSSLSSSVLILPFKKHLKVLVFQELKSLGSFLKTFQ